MRRLAVASACLLLLVAACRGARLRPDWQTSAGERAASPRRETPAPVRPGHVALSDADLAPVDAWHGARNAQWILGDVVDVYASREYYAQILTLNERVGMIHRKDEAVGDDTLVTMTWLGHPDAASAMSNPRAQIGPGITVTARKTLRVRLAKTRDAARPIQLRVLAQGKARRGRGDTVEARGETLEIGGVMRHEPGGWRWIPIVR